VRGHVAAGGNTLGEGLTIPDELLAAALDMVAYRLTTRLGLTVKDERKAAYEQADRLLVRVAAGQLRVVAPETPASTQAAGASIALVHSRTRLTGRMEGL
jgi:phage gp36-like protein